MERSTTIPIHRRHDHVHRKSQGIQKIPLELRKFNKVAGYKISTQNSFVFLYTSNEESKNKIK